MENMSEEKLKEVSGGTYDLVDTQVNGDVTSYTFIRQGGRAVGRRSAGEAGAREDEFSVLNALPSNVVDLLKSKREAYIEGICEKGGTIADYGIVPSARRGAAGFKINVNNATGELYYINNATGEVYYSY